MVSLEALEDLLCRKQSGTAETQCDEQKLQQTRTQRQKADTANRSRSATADSQKAETKNLILAQSGESHPQNQKPKTKNQILAAFRGACTESLTQKAESESRKQKPALAPGVGLEMKRRRSRVQNYRNQKCVLC